MTTAPNDPSLVKSAREDDAAPQERGWYYSKSQVGMWIRCGAQWEARYVAGLKSPPTSALVTGIAVHAGANLAHAVQKETGAAPSISDVKDAAATTFEREVALQGLTVDPEDGDDSPAAARGRIKDAAVVYAETYARELVPGVRPVEVEWEFKLRWPGVGYGLTGFVDLVEYIGPEALGGIGELKTAAKRDKYISGGQRLELGIYSLAYQEVRGALPVRAAVRKVIKNKTPVTDLLSFVPTADDVRLAKSTLAHVHAGVSAGVFAPNRDSFLCSRRQCGFWKWCEAKHGGRVRD